METAVRQPVYRKVASAIVRQIVQGVLQEGDRVPSVRSLSRDQRVSIATAVQAYVFLERRGFLEARPRSGFFVRPPVEKDMPEPDAAPVLQSPMRLSMAELAAEACRRASDPRRVPLGTASPGPDLMPFDKLNRLTREVIRQYPKSAVELTPIEGLESLRREIAKHAMRFGFTFAADEVVVTVGTTEALQLALRAVAKPGDLVAVESPSYFGILQTMELLGLRALEIPTDTRYGIDLWCLEDAARRHKLAACVTMSCCHNPLGCVIPEERRKALAGLAATHNLPIIEDDVWGDIIFGDKRGKPIKSYDRDGLVLYCTSFSKSVTPGGRVGWIHAGRFTDAVKRLKTSSTGPNPTLPQRVVESFLATGGYERHVRGLRRRLQEQSERYRNTIYEVFPPGTRVSRPEGGCFLWLQLPKGVDCDELCARALEVNISLMPGRAFSASKGFADFVRISSGHPYSDRIERALEEVGQLVTRR